MTPDTLDALAAADPARDVDIAPEHARRILRAATAQPARRRRWIVPTAAVVAALAVGIPGVAVASGYLARTGWFGSPSPGSPEGTRPLGTEADGSEWIDTSASDYGDYAVTLWPSYAPLPDGYDTGMFARAIASDGPEGLRQVTGIRSEFEQNARCAWRAEWLDADAVGDAARAAVAARTLTEAATWPATVATDGGGIVDEERALATAAVAGDRAVVQTVDAWCGEMLEGRAR